jgi:hypothetical protein
MENPYASGHRYDAERLGAHLQKLDAFQCGHHLCIAYII